MAYTIRPWQDGDAAPLEAAALAAINEIGPRKYTQEQVDAWAGRLSSHINLADRVARGAYIFVAEDGDGLPVAYALLEPDGHLDHLYCHPDHTRRELAEQLLVAAEHFARPNGIERLFSEASELARPVFERAGYTVSHRRDLQIGGVPIHNFAMEKSLK